MFSARSMYRAINKSILERLRRLNKARSTRFPSITMAHAWCGIGARFKRAVGHYFSARR